MKKVICLFCALALSMSLSACKKTQGEMEETTTEHVTESTREIFQGSEYMHLGERIAVSENLDVSLMKITTTESVEPLMHSDNSFKAEYDDFVFVDVVFEAENVGNGEVSCQGVAKAEFESTSGVYAEARYFFEHNNYKSLAEHTRLKNGKKTLLHTCIYVPKTERSGLIRVGFEEAVLLYDYELFAQEKSIATIRCGERIAGDGTYLTIENIHFSPELHPSVESKSAYTFYKTDEKNATYMIIEALAENYTGEDIVAPDFAKIDVSIGGEKKSGGFWVCEQETGDEFLSESVIGEGKSVRAYYVVPIEEKQSGLQYDVDIVFNREEYTLK